MDMTKNMTVLDTTPDFLFNVQAGLVPGVSQVRKYGINPDVDTGTDPEDIWEAGGNYVYDTSNQVMYIYSNNAADTETVTVEGLVEEDGAWNPKSVEVVVNGTTPVLVGGFIRVFRARVTSATDTIGTIFITVGNSGTLTPANNILRAEINPGKNSTLMSMYTVPSGYTAFIYRLFASVGKLRDAEVSWKIRPFNQVFLTTAIIGHYQMSAQYELAFEPAYEKSDIKVSAETENNNTEVRTSFHMLLVDNDYLNDTVAESV